MRTRATVALRAVAITVKRRTIPLRTVAARGTFAIRALALRTIPLRTITLRAVPLRAVIITRTTVIAEAFAAIIARRTLRRTRQGLFDRTATGRFLSGSNRLRCFGSHRRGGRWLRGGGFRLGLSPHFGRTTRGLIAGALFGLTTGFGLTAFLILTGLLDHAGAALHLLLTQTASAA